MSLRQTINDNYSQLDFYDGLDDAHRLSSFVQWTYLPDPGLISGADFTPEPINNISNGIPGGKYPLKGDFENIIGYTPQVDAEPSLGGSVLRCEVVDPPVNRTVELWYSTLNEFYHRIDPVCGGNNPFLGSTEVEVRTKYALDGAGNITVDVNVVSYASIAPVIQNIHFAEIAGGTNASLYDFNYLVDWWTPFGYRIQEYDTAQWFNPQPGFDPANHDTYMLFDPAPKSGYTVNAPFRWDVCTTRGDWYYTYTYQNPRALGVLRKSDGHGVLVVHGNLPAGSQPCIVSVLGIPPAGIVPIITQLAIPAGGYAPQTQTLWRVFILPMNGQNNSDQKNRALQLANYNNPISVNPL